MRGSGVKAKIVNVGNPKGIRIPKLLLDEAKLKEELELEAENGCLIVRNV